MSKRRLSKAQRESKEKFEALIPEEMRQRLFDHLYSGERLLSEGSPFSELLQGAVNSMLSAEADHHIETEKAQTSVAAEKMNQSLTDQK